MLSVIVPIYNEEEYLEQCVESIRNQSYKLLDIILVNDGSTDASGELCDLFSKQDKRVKVIHKKNGGMISARYAGLLAAKSEYVAFVDGDDWIKSDMYDRLMDIMIKEDVDVVTSGQVVYKGESNWWERKDERIIPGRYNRQALEDKIIPRMMWEKGYETPPLSPSLCNKILKKNILLKCYEKLKDCTFSAYEDAAIVYPYVLKANSIYLTHDCYYFYRHRQYGEMVEYFQDDNFLDKLYGFYTFLKQIFSADENHKVLIKQLEYHYSKAVGSCKDKYQEKLKESFTYLFPFNKVDKNSSIVLYGAGNVGHEYYEQIKRLEYCKIVLWVDKNYLNYDSEKIVEVKKILDVEYDYIVIANKSENITKFIIKDLEKMGVPKNKIVDIPKAIRVY